MTLIEEHFTFFPVDLTGKLPSISPGTVWSWWWVERDDNRAARSIVGWTAELEIRATPNGPLIKKLSTATGEITNGGVTGKFTVTLSAADTALISAGTVVFDVKTTAPGINPLHELTASVEVRRVAFR